MSVYRFISLMVAELDSRVRATINSMAKETADECS